MPEHIETTNDPHLEGAAPKKGLPTWAKIAGLIAFSLVVVAASLLIGAAVARAQDPTPTPTPPDGWFGPRGGRMGGVLSAYDDQIHAALADALGMTEEEFEAARAEGKTLAQIAEEQGVALEDVQAAMQAAFEEALQQAVEDGTLTQEQADAMLERMQARGAFAPGMRGGGRGEFGPGDGGVLSAYDDQIHAALADALGMTEEELEAARAEGKTLAQIAEEQGVALEDVQAAMQAAFEEALQQAVEDGVLTQEQADAMLERMQARGAFAPGMRGGGRGGMRGDGFGPCDPAAVQPQS
jgi:DNA-directed RNA polymerase specialized sigma24 family protein